jgi:hypothetical protein
MKQEEGELQSFSGHLRRSFGHPNFVKLGSERRFVPACGRFNKYS